MKGRWQSSPGSEGWREAVTVEDSSKTNELRIQIEDQETVGTLMKKDAHRGVLNFQGESIAVTWSKDSRGIWITGRGRTVLFRQVSSSDSGREEEGSLSSPMPAKVLQVLVSVGDTVEEGDVLIRLEAMKMEHSLKAPASGKIEALHAIEGDQVEAGVALVELS